MTDVDWSRRLKWGLRFVLASVGAFIASLLIIGMTYVPVRDLISVMTGYSVYLQWGYYLIMVAFVAALLVAPRFARQQYSLERLLAFSALLIISFFVASLIARSMGPVEPHLGSREVTTLAYSFIPSSSFMAGLLLAHELVYRGGYERARAWLSG